MTKKNSLKALLVMLAISLISSSAFAQLSLSADAEASADAEGAKASADAEGDAAASEETAEPAPAPAAAAPMDSPIPMDEGADVPTDAVGTAGYDNGFFIKTNDDKFKLVIHGMAKARFNYLNDEYAVISDDGITPGTNHTNHANFSVPYARIHLSGNMFTPKLGYTLYYDFAQNNLIYAYATWTFIPEKLVIKVGQFKRPFSRGYLISSVKRQFIHNPLGQFGQAVDVGAQIGNNFMKTKGLVWAVSVTNGEQSGNFADFSPMLTGRIGFNNGIKGYSETDFEGGPLRFGVALSASTEFDHDNNDNTNHFIGLDGMLKVAGLSVTAAGYIENVADKFMWDGANLNRIGTYIGAGYLIKGLLEPVARYGMVHNYQFDEDIQEEITAGLTLHFIEGHHFKWENNVSLLTTRGPNADFSENETTRDIAFTSQLQFYF